jgi:hypothetical protein
MLFLPHWLKLCVWLLQARYFYSPAPPPPPFPPVPPRYLDVLAGNPSWTFAQRRQAVLRLGELSAHFARQPDSAFYERGSPFAPLFEAPSAQAPALEGGKGKDGKAAAAGGKAGKAGAGKEQQHGQGQAGQAEVESLLVPKLSRPAPQVPPLAEASA